MSARDQQRRLLASVFGTGVVKGTDLEGESVMMAVQGMVEQVPPAEGCEPWCDAALISRPQDGAECLYIELEGERTVFATRDRRWQIEVQKGEAVLRAMGAGSPAYIRLRPDGTVQVAASAIHLGAESVTSFVALANLVDARLSAMVTYINAHTHITTATIGATATVGVNSPPAPPLSPQLTVAATKTRAQ